MLVRASNRMILAVLVLGTSVGLLAGCGRKTPPAPRNEEALYREIAETQSRADEIFGARDTMRLVRGRWAGRGVRSTFEARRAGDVVRFIEEQEDRGEFGASDNRYYFDVAGTFFFYEDRGEEKEPRGALPTMSRLIQRSLIFDPQGRAVWGRRLVDGVAGAVPDSQAVAIRERAGVLLAAAAGMSP